MIRQGLTMLMACSREIGAWIRGISGSEAPLGPEDPGTIPVEDAADEE
jgi:hypothetical protein